MRPSIFILLLHLLSLQTEISDASHQKGTDVITRACPRDVIGRPPKVIHLLSVGTSHQAQVDRGIAAAGNARPEVPTGKSAVQLHMFHHNRSMALN